MKIYNKNKTKELKTYDLTKGYLLSDKLLVETKLAVEGLRGELEIYEDIQVYIEYTAKELAEKEISELRQKLNDTDYKAIRYAEGSLTAEEFEAIRQQRIDWRNRIKELEKILL